MLIRTMTLGLALSCLVAWQGIREVRAAGGASVPSNYRQLVARTILANTDGKTIRRARISRPERMAGGLFGGAQTVVCAEVIRETPLTSNARDHWVFTFQDGRIASAGYSWSECKSYSPFEELHR
jgi:hypothetical protein